jgi:class 3 adenylate cyclase
MVAVTSITGDLVLMLSGSIFFGNTIYKLRKSIAVRELENQEYASRFLGPAVSRAIFEENREILKTEKKIGFILMIDIRDSTKLVQESPQKWLSFQAAYFKAVAAIVKKHGGYIQKTQGDCHVINFGVVEYHPDLSDIAGLEEELARAEERRLKQVSDRVFACADEIFDVGMKLGVEIVGEKGVCFGGGVDKGLVEKRVQGDEAAFLELEVNGDAVHCAARLQDHSKKIRAELCPQDSILLVSPFASDYLTDLSGMQRISALDNPIRNYPGIKWVLAKVYKNPAISSGGLEKHVA